MVMKIPGSIALTATQFNTGEAGEEDVTIAREAISIVYESDHRIGGCEDAVGTGRHTPDSPGARQR